MTDERTPTTWPEDTEPTAEQLADWLTACTREELVAFAARSLKVIAVAARCFEHGHEARIDHLQRVADSIPEPPGAHIKGAPGCADHREVQHRDRQPPWCDECGWSRGSIQYATHWKGGLSRAEREARVASARR